MFFLKADKRKDGSVVVRVYAELVNGFVGLADESVKQAKPHLWTEFQDGLKEFGEDKAHAIALHDGEFRLPVAPRAVGVVERDIRAATKKLEELQAEHEAAVKLSVEEVEPTVESEPEKKGKKKKKEVEDEATE